jgi:hypothetical protein
MEVPVRIVRASGRRSAHPRIDAAKRAVKFKHTESGGVNQAMDKTVKSAEVLLATTFTW